MVPNASVKAEPSPIQQIAEMLHINDAHSKSLKGEVAHVISGRYSFLLEHSLKALGVEVHRGNRIDVFAASPAKAHKADFVILADDIAKNVSVDQIEDLRAAAPQIGILAIGPHAPELVENGLADVAIAGLSKEKAVCAALCELSAFQRMAHLEENAVEPHVPVFHQQVKRRRSLFDRAQPVELRQAA
jgi:hypothetical protein